MQHPQTIQRTRHMGMSPPVHPTRMPQRQAIRLHGQPNVTSSILQLTNVMQQWNNYGMDLQHARIEIGGEDDHRSVGLQNVERAIVTLGGSVQIAPSTMYLSHVENQRCLHDGTNLVQQRHGRTLVDGEPERGGLDGFQIGEGVHPLVEVHALVDVRCSGDVGSQ